MSSLERRYYGETQRKASWTSYLMLCFCLLISSATSNIALAYINYPTKVVFRSCKLIPTMLIAVMYNRKKIAWYEFLFGVLISMGMVLFAAADFQVYPNFDFVGKFDKSFCYLVFACVTTTDNNMLFWVRRYHSGVCFSGSRCIPSQLSRANIRSRIITDRGHLLHQHFVFGLYDCGVYVVG